MGYLICSKCKGYYQLPDGQSPGNYTDQCSCGGKIRYADNLDIVDPRWKPITIKRKKTRREILNKKVRKTFTLPNWDLKKRLKQYNQNLKYRFDRARNQRTINKNPQGMDWGNVNSWLNELNFNNIRWVVVIPVIISISLILAYLPGIYTLLTLIMLVAVGYLFDNQVIGVKNALITGAVSFFLGTLLTGSFLLMIPYAFLGAVNGAVCGWIGNYLKKRF